MALDCHYCGEPAQLTSGAAVYPHRPDLARKQFWVCAPCKAWVGVHPGTEKPLGILAKAELRKLKSQVHAAFDPVWRGAGKSRKDAYAWLAAGLGIPGGQCHVGLFDEARCGAALAFLAGVAA